MKEVHRFLADWVKVYVKSKDAVDNSIESVTEGKESDLIVKYKDREEFYIILPFIKDDSVLNKLTNDKIIILVVFNSKENFEFIAENWKRFIDLPDFRIMFVNPFSEMDEKWVIKPYMHHKICDEDSLKLGLKSMFNMVTPVNEEVVKEKIQNQK